MKVLLTYFKPGGKYYSDGSYETDKEHLHDIFEEVRLMHSASALPDLSTGGKGGWYHVLVSVPEHEYNHPHLVPSTAASEEL